MELSFEDMRNIEKVMKLGIFPEFQWGEPIKTTSLQKIKEIIEEGKNYLYTKELLEKVLQPLGVKKSWMYQLEEEGLIRPSGTIEIKISSRKIVDAKLWDTRKISKEQIKNWVENKEKQTKVNRALAREKISKTLKTVHKIAKEKRKEKEEILTLLKSYHPFLETAFYLYHLNHYAKTPKYQAYKNKLYTLKTKTLIKASSLYKELFKINFIERGDKIELCDECFEEARKNWHWAGGYETGYTLGEWIKAYHKPCPSCKVEKDFYSLVEFQIKTPVAKFNFHLPYPEAKSSFNKENLPKKQLDQEYLYISLGREIEKYEALIVPIKEVISKIEKFLEGKTN